MDKHTKSLRVNFNEGFYITLHNEQESIVASSSQGAPYPRINPQDMEWMLDMPIRSVWVKLALDSKDRFLLDSQGFIIIDGVHEHTIGALAKELNYQQHYSYEQRVELFNKYNISVATNYINPIMLLTEHLHRGGDSYTQYHSFRFHGVSHSGAVATAFNQKFTEGQADYVEKKEFPLFDVYRINNYRHKALCMVQVAVFKERLEGVTFCIKNIEGSLWGKRNFNLVTAAEEFCKDFGFTIKFV